MHDPAGHTDWHSFPRVRDPLIAWGMLAPDATPADIETRLGIRVTKVEIRDQDAQSGLASFILEHRPDLIVLAARGREGISRLLHGSVSRSLVLRTHVPAIVFGPESMGFVNQQSGEVEIRRVLMPVTAEPDPAAALRAAHSLLAPLGVASSAFQLLNVGGGLQVTIGPDGRSVDIAHRDGDVVPVILDEARARGVDIIALPTAGRNGMLDFLRGSTTSQLIAHAPCPVLTIPLATG